MRKIIAAIIIAGALLAGCASPALAPTPTPIEVVAAPPGITARPTQVPTATPTHSATSTPMATPTPEPTNTPIPPTPVPRVLTPSDFSFPVAFEGPYAVGHPVAYAPCYHWDPNAFDPDLVTPENWYNYFHAGDMYVLSNSGSPERIVVLSPVTGVVESTYDIGPDGIVVIVRAQYSYDRHPIHVDIAHVTGLFPGDEEHPMVEIGSSLKQGDPIAIQETVFQFGRPEQALDIEIRMGPGSNYPLAGDWAPESFLDPFPFLEDDLSRLGPSISFDYHRPHCLQSGHFP